MDGRWRTGGGVPCSIPMRFRAVPCRRPPGNAVAACCVTALGAYDGIRSMAETLAFMAETLAFMADASQPESACG